MLIVNKYTIRRPVISAMSPMIAGAIPATIMYEVIVRLIFPVETWRDVDRAFMAGKKIKDDNGENVAAKVIRKTIRRFSIFVKCE